MPRSPGSLLRATCCLCGTVERSPGTSGFYRCTACKAANRFRPGSRFAAWSGKEQAGGEVNRAIRDGVLPHPRGLTCTDCGVGASEYEHRNYNKPLAVDPICRKCNARRGPAIPLVGALRREIERGKVPYRLGRSAQRLMASMGVDVGPLPVKMTVEAWQELLPLIDRAERVETIAEGC